MMKQNSVFSLIIAGCILFLFSCQSYRYRVAETYYEQNAYAKAIPKYEQVLEKNFVPDAAEKLANCYRQTGNSVKAEFWYRRLINESDAKPENKLALGECLMENGKYEEASDWLQQYLKLNSSDNRVKRLIRSCDSIDSFFRDTNVFVVTLPAFNNSTEANFSPAFYHDGIIFLSDRPAQGKNRQKSFYTGREFLDLFYTRKTDDAGHWLLPELLKGDINGPFDEGPASFTGDMKTMYFTRNDYDGHELETNEKNVNLLKIFKAVLNGNQWKTTGPESVNSPDYSVGHPAISADGNILIFASDMPWGYGGTDLYSVIKDQSGQWGKPINLGNKINTEGNEMFPFVSADGVLYFASDGQMGMGGLDIFECFPSEDGWKGCENLGYPVNSSKDDFGFIIDSTGIHGYFSSSRNKNIDQIFEFTKKPPVFTVNLTVVENKKRSPLSKVNAHVTVDKNKLPDLLSDIRGTIEVQYTKSGLYTLEFKPKGYYKRTFVINTAGERKSKVYSDTLVLEKIELRKKLDFPGLSFPGKSTDLTTDVKAGLDSLCQLMKDNPEIQVEISSHTDSKGYSGTNLKTSNKRSDDMALYLIGKGISSSRIISLGYGESRLLNNCRDGILCLEEDHQVNNRVEVRVVDLLY